MTTIVGDVQKHTVIENVNGQVFIQDSVPANISKAPEEVLNAQNLLTSTTIGDRRRGITALAKIELPEATEALANALRNGYPDVRLGAAMQLASRKDTRAISALARELLSRQNQSLGDPNHAEIVSLLASFDRDAVSTLCELLRHPNSIVRQHVVVSLGRSGDAGATPYLVCALKDKDTAVRGHAADVLAKMKPKDSNVVSALIELLSDDTEITHYPERRWLLPTMSDTAYLALSEIDTPKARKAAKEYRALHAERLADATNPSRARGDRPLVIATSGNEGTP